MTLGSSAKQTWSTLGRGADDRPAILVVDDHLPNLLAVEAVLDGMGYPLLMVQSGHEALTRALPKQVALILMDVHMPVLDGYDTVALLRRDHAHLRDVPVVFLTAEHGGEEDIHRGYALGAVDYIVKPFDPYVFRSKIHALVGLYLRGLSTERARSDETHRMKDVFLGAVGHDLRNPLNAILVASKLLGMAACSEPSHAQVARRITRSAERMNGIIEDILDLTRGQFTGGIPLARAPTDLAALSHKVAEELRAGHPERVIRVHVEGEPLGDWDGSRLGRVLSNLLGNAVQHGGDAGPIEVDVADRGALVRVSIHNGGEPIAADALPFVFEPFRIGGSHSHGLGLGLFIAREIIRAHGGHISVTSSAAKGTRFTVHLPKEPVNTSQTEPLSLAEEP